MLYEDGHESARLTTRFFNEGDAPAWVAYTSDEVATRFTAVPNLTPEVMAAHFVSFSMARYREGRFGLQALITKDTNELVGACGLMLQEVSGQMEIEIGYHLIRKYWGHGYASEAAQLFRDYGFRGGFAESIVSVIDPLNQLSKNVAMRNGMRLVATDAEHKGVLYHLYRITRNEWDQLKR